MTRIRELESSLTQAEEEKIVMQAQVVAWQTQLKRQSVIHAQQQPSTTAMTSVSAVTHAQPSAAAMTSKNTVTQQQASATSSIKTVDSAAEEAAHQKRFQQIKSELARALVARVDSEQRLCQLKSDNQKAEAELCTLRSALAVSEQLCIEQQLTSSKKQHRGQHQLQTKLRESERQRLLLDEQLELEKSERQKLLNSLRLSERQLFKVTKEAANVVESYKLRLQAQEDDMRNVVETQTEKAQRVRIDERATCIANFRGALEKQELRLR